MELQIQNQNESTQPMVDVLPFLPFAKEINHGLNNHTIANEVTLFKTDLSKNKLFEYYLASFPEDQRQVHNCNCCRKFLNKIGDLVTINEDGSIKSAVWNNEHISKLVENKTHFHEQFGTVVDQLAAAVERANIDRVFYTKDKHHGKMELGGHNHFYHSLSTYAFDRSSMEVNKQSKMHLKMLKSSLAIRLESIKYTLNLFEYSKGLKGFTKQIDTLKSMLALLDSHDSTLNQKLRVNFLWRVVASVNMNLINFKNTALGNLCLGVQSSIENKTSVEPYVGIYLEQMKSENYMRPIALPTVGQKELAEKIFADLNAASALLRRTATIDDVLEFKWKPPVKEVAVEDTSKPAKIFDSVKTKDQADTKQVKQTIDGGLITLNELVNRVLPLAMSFHVLMNRTTSYTLGFLSTAQDPDATPIYKWDSLEKRNPVCPLRFVIAVPCFLTGINPDEPVEVKGITVNPEFWGKDETDEKTNYFILMFDSNGKTDVPISESAIFPECLRSEFYPVRKTIEQYSASNPIQQTPGQLVTLTIGAGSGVFNLPVVIEFKDTVVKYTVDRF